MPQSTSFDDVLDAVEHLSAEEQEALIEVVQRRISDRRRKGLAAEIAEARQEFKNGGCRSMTANEIADEIAQ